MDALDDFYTGHPFVAWHISQHSKKDIFKFSKSIGFWTWWLLILRMPHHANMLRIHLRVYKRLNQKCMDVHFLFLPKLTWTLLWKYQLQTF